MKLAEKMDIDKISYKFENWSVLELRPRDSCKNPLFNFVMSVTHSVLIESSWNFS